MQEIYRLCYIYRTQEISFNRRGTQDSYKWKFKKKRMLHPMELETYIIRQLFTQNIN